MVKIIDVNEEAITFSNGMKIVYDHDQECCEWNYADFLQLEEEAKIIEFDESTIKFENSDYGFRFGSDGTRMFFVPCYSEQSGYYTPDVDIYVEFENGERKKVINVKECELIDYWR